MQAKQVVALAPSTPIDPLAIQSYILQIAQNNSSKEAFIQSLLQFIKALTNAHGVMLLGPQKKEPCIMAKVIALEIEEIEDSICDKAKSIMTDVLQQQKSQVGKLQHNEQIFYLLLAPIVESTHSKATTTLGMILELAEGDEIEPFLFLLQLIAGYIPITLQQQNLQKRETVAQNAAVFVELMTLALYQTDLQRSMQVVVDQMQNHLHCQRVVLGITKRWHCRVASVSGREKFDKRSSLTRALEAAMSESLRERKAIYYPQLQDDKRSIQVDLAHQELQKLLECTQIVTHPLYNEQQEEVGAWIFIWKDYTVKEQQYHLITATSSHITALLQSLIKSQPFWLGKFIRNLGSYMRQVRYVAAVLSVFAFILLLRMPYTHSIESPCELVPVVRHSVAAPFDGVLQKTFYEPGDLVKQGQVMAVLDDREIRLELTSGQEALATTRKKMDLHFAEEQMAEYQMATLEANKIEQRIKLLQYRLENLNIKAPKSGILLQGDLERAIGITVKTGQVLFEVAPLEKLYVQIAIAEEDISYIKLELPGKLHINSYPDNQWDLKVGYISPISQAQENNNVFVCEAIIDNSDGNLLSGMKGNVKLDAGKRPLWWVFFHKPIEWLRAKMWW